MGNYSDITPKIKDLSQLCFDNSHIDSELYSKFDVKKGLRDINGKGVLTGLTEISEIRQSKIEDGKEIPWHGRLFYRGYDIEDMRRLFTFCCSANFRQKTLLRSLNQCFRSTERCRQIL